jgi:CHAT domain-containing protein
LGELYGAKQSRVYLGAEALEERFKAEAANYRILHLATHGVLSGNSPMYSHIVLSQSGGSGKEDGLLEAREILDLDLKADLAVLSACETARGRVGAGEGVIGLSWALFVAGVPATVVSHWKVQDASTRQLMVEFHRQMKSNPARGKAEALRQAALNVMKTARLPYFWAGFMLVGDGR